MTTSSTTARPARTHPPASGWWLALVSAAGFGTSGVFAKSLLDAGWSPGGAVTVRIAGAAVVLAVPAAFALRGRWRVLGAHWRLLTVYGLIAMAACQFCYFNAVTRLPVGVALLIEYLAPVLLIGWFWWRTGRRPSAVTVVGAACSVLGLALVLDVTGSVEVDPIGVAWALAAAVSVAVYFLLSGRQPDGLPPLVMSAAGLVVASVALLAVGVSGLMPLQAAAGEVTFLDRQVHWSVPATGMVVLSTALAYATGIAGTRRLGSRLASFVGLSEVLCAVLFAWLLLGELPVPIQLVGGALIVAGVACIRYDELTSAPGVPAQ